VDSVGLLPNCMTVTARISSIVFVIVAAGAARAAEQSSVTPSQIVVGRSVEVTPEASATAKIPQDARQLTVTVGMQHVHVLRVNRRRVAFVAPAYARGTGERDVALFGNLGRELARATVGYEHAGADSPIRFLLFLLALPLLMLSYHIRQAYLFASDTGTAIINYNARDGMTLDELKLLLAELGQSPPGIPGLARTLMADNDDSRRQG